MNLVTNITEAKDTLLQAITFGAFHRAEEFKHAYHYTSLSGLKGILDSSEFYLTEYHYLNDMEEFEYVDRLLWEVLEEELSASSKWDVFKAAVERQLHVCRTQTLKPEESFYVLSFSQQRDNLTLWAEFASYGCNFKVNPYSIFEGSVLEHSVIYDKEEQLELVRSCIRDSLENFYEYVDVEHPLPLAQLLDVFNVEIMECAAECIVKLVEYYGMLIKNSLYEAEKEFRIVFSGKGREIHYRMKENLLIPYIKLPLPKQINWFGNRVTLAPLNHEEACRNSIRSYLYSQGYENVEVCFSDIHLRY